jgi:chaperone BCS1
MLQRRLITTLEIPIHDPSYPWILDWLSKQERAVTGELSSGMLRKLMAKVNPPSPHVLSVNTTFLKRENGSTAVDMTLRPGIGVYFLKYKGVWIEVRRSRETKMVDLKSGSPWEQIQFRTLSMDKHLFNDMLAEAKKTALSKEIGKTVIYTSYGHEWRPFGMPRRKRVLSSVILKDDLAERIFNDVSAFLRNGAWYYQRGIPYRRGYLLFGPPGSGKTSFIQALAGELDYNVCVLNLAERGLTDDRLSHLLSNAPPRSIILLEDVDAAFSSRDVSQSHGYVDLKLTLRQSMLTFSGLLNALDGVASSEERILFMTTNHIERLDPALIRPGRVDVKHSIDWASDDQIEKMFMRFYPDSTASKLFVKNVRESASGTPVSTAQLQGHFVLYRDDSQLAITSANVMFNS